MIGDFDDRFAASTSTSTSKLETALWLVGRLVCLTLPMGAGARGRRHSLQPLVSRIG